MATGCSVLFIRAFLSYSGLSFFRESVCLRAGFGVAGGYDCFHDPSKPPAWRFEKFSVLIGSISILDTYARTRHPPRPRVLLRHGGGSGGFTQASRRLHLTTSAISPQR